MSSENLVTEVPSGLRKLARLVVRGFYSVEDTLIIDMLVRNPCMREDDICELLKFEKKMLRARIATLKNDKFIQVRLRMETGEDGKAQKVNYYFINYKTFVNVVKYKLDLMRKRMETEERDATSRASFKCPKCAKTFTDLEADQLFNPMTGEFTCTYCGSVVEEDMSAMPKKDSRMQMARFNSQMEPLFDLLRQVEGIKLAPEVLEPEPVDINTIRGVEVNRGGREDGVWSGELTRNQGLAVEETRVNVTIAGDDDDAAKDAAQARKERPVWMVDSTVLPNQYNQNDGVGEIASTEEERVSSSAGGGGGGNQRGGDDIMSVLLAHEKKGGAGGAAAANSQAVSSLLHKPSNDSDSSDNDIDDFDDTTLVSPNNNSVELVESDDDELVPVVTVGDQTVPITEVTDSLIKTMTPHEKEAYIQLYQEYYSHMYD